MKWKMWYWDAAQSPLQRSERRLLHPFERQRAGLDQVAERLVEPLPLPFDVERRVVRRARNHRQHANRRRHRNRLQHLRQVHVADERRLDRQREKAVDALDVEELPRQVGQCRVGQAQPHADTGVVALGLVDAAAQAGPHVAAEHGVEERRPERFRGRHLGRLEPPHRSRRPAEAKQAVFELDVGKRQDEVGGRLTGGRVEHLRSVSLRLRAR